MNSPLEQECVAMRWRHSLVVQSYDVMDDAVMCHLRAIFVNWIYLLLLHSLFNLWELTPLLLVARAFYIIYVFELITLPKGMSGRLSFYL